MFLKLLLVRDSDKEALYISCSGLLGNRSDQAASHLPFSIISLWCKWWCICVDDLVMVTEKIQEKTSMRFWYL